MKVVLDRFDLYYYVEGLAKYGFSNEVWQWCIDILPKISNGMRESLLEWTKRDLGYLYGYDKAWNAIVYDPKEKDAFDAFQRVYEVPIANTDKGVLEVDMDLAHLKCYIQSKGKGSHLRQDIWEWLNNSYKHFFNQEREEIFVFLRDTFSESHLHLVGGDEHYNQCLARYNPDNQYIVEYEYRHRGKRGNGEESAYLFRDNYYIDSRRFITDWKEGKDYVRITRITKNV